MTNKAYVCFSLCSVLYVSPGKINALKKLDCNVRINKTLSRFHVTFVSVDKK